jgi:hypothetical protein
MNSERRAVVHIALIAAAGFLAWPLQVHLHLPVRLSEEVLQDTSRLSGQKRIDKLLDDREDRFHNELGMHKQVSLKPLESLPKDAGLSDTRVSAEEQLAMFLHFARRGLSNEDRKSDLSSAQVPSQSQFYVLCWVLSHQPIRCIHRMLDALILRTFHRAYIRLLRSNAPGPALIEREERFFPFLRIALALSMDSMSLYICLLKCFALHIETERASYLRMGLRLFLLTGDSSISCLDWRAMLPIIVYTMTLAELTSRS